MATIQCIMDQGQAAGIKLDRLSIDFTLRFNAGLRRATTVCVCVCVCVCVV